MKTSALIITSFLVGALVTLALIARDEGTAQVPEIVRPVAVRAAVDVPVAPSPTKARMTGTSSNRARIVIPRLHLNTRVGTNLDDGPAWWPITGRPGGNDTIAIAGHRTTHTHPFLNLDRLEPGDAIYLSWRGVTHRYVMSGRRIVSSTHQHIADARGYELLLLTACTPKGSARQRIVIYAWPDRARRQSDSRGS